MDKKHWLDFTSYQLRTQTSAAAFRKVQSWAFLLLGFVSFGFAVNVLSQMGGRAFLFSAKVLYLALFHITIALAVYLPLILQKGEKSISRTLGISDLTSLVFVCLALLVVGFSTWMLGGQVIAAIAESRMTGFFVFSIWAHHIFIAAYGITAIFAAASFFLFPTAIVKVSAKMKKAHYVLLGLHAAMASFLLIGYHGLVKIGSITFFEQFRIVGLFGLFVLACLFVSGRFFKYSPAASLAELEHELAAGKFDHDEDILNRFSDAFVSEKIAFWIKRVSHRAATQSHDIAACVHDVVSLAEKKSPSEFELRQLEERSKKSESLYKKLERENQRFLICLSVFDLADVERGKVEVLRDVFSRELRNAKIELADIKKRVDDKFVAVKDTTHQITAQAAPVTPEATPTEEVVSKAK